MSKRSKRKGGSLSQPAAKKNNTGEPNAGEEADELKGEPDSYTKKTENKEVEAYEEADEEADECKAERLATHRATLHRLNERGRSGSQSGSQNLNDLARAAACPCPSPVCLDERFYVNGELQGPALAAVVRYSYNLLQNSSFLREIFSPDCAWARLVASWVFSNGYLLNLGEIIELVSNIRSSLCSPETYCEKNKVQVDFAKVEDSLFDSKSHAEYPHCAMCLSPFAQGDDIKRVRDCRHIYHRTCLLQCADKNPTCPCCKSSLN